MSSAASTSMALATTTWVLVILILAVILVTTVLVGLNTRPSPVPVLLDAALREAERSRRRRRQRDAASIDTARTAAEELAKQPGLASARAYTGRPQLKTPLVVVHPTNDAEYETAQQTIEDSAVFLPNMTDQHRFKRYYARDGFLVMLVRPADSNMEEADMSPDAENALAAMDIMFNGRYYAKKRLSTPAKSPGSHTPVRPVMPAACLGPAPAPAPVPVSAVVPLAA